jgi:hypothetical protein
MKYQSTAIEVDEWAFHEASLAPQPPTVNEKPALTVFPYRSQDGSGVMKVVLHWDVQVKSNVNGKLIFILVAEHTLYVEFDKSDTIGEFENLIKHSHLNLQVALSSRTRGTVIEPYALGLEPDQLRAFAETVQSALSST